MKIKLILATLLMLANLVFCQEKIRTEKGNEVITIDNTENGKVVNGVYVCNRFDWEIKVPENYSVSDVQKLNELEDKGVAQVEKSLPENARAQRRTHLIGFELNSANTFSASFNPLEPTVKMSLTEHKNFIVETLKKSYGSIKGATFEFKPSDLKIGEHQFYKVVVKVFNASNGKLALTQIYYNSYVKNHLFSALISYNIASEGKIMEDNFLTSLK